MKKEEIHLWDCERLLLGHPLGHLMLELLLRTLVVYPVLLVVIRLLGKRMSAQLTITEMVVFIHARDHRVAAPAGRRPWPVARHSSLRW